MAVSSFHVCEMDAILTYLMTIVYVELANNMYFLLHTLSLVLWAIYSSENPDDATDEYFVDSGERPFKSDWYIIVVTAARSPSPLT